MQKRCNSSALVMELHVSSIMQSPWYYIKNSNCKGNDIYIILPITHQLNAWMLILSDLH